jgi:hypothetical protein
MSDADRNLALFLFLEGFFRRPLFTIASSEFLVRFGWPGDGLSFDQLLALGNATVLSSSSSRRFAAFKFVKGSLRYCIDDGEADGESEVGLVDGERAAAALAEEFLTSMVPIRALNSSRRDPSGNMKLS